MNLSGIAYLLVLLPLVLGSYNTTVSAFSLPEACYVSRKTPPHGGASDHRTFFSTPREALAACGNKMNRTSIIIVFTDQAYKLPPEDFVVPERVKSVVLLGAPLSVSDTGLINPSVVIYGNLGPDTDRAFDIAIENLVFDFSLGDCSMGGARRLVVENCVFKMANSTCPVMFDMTEGGGAKISNNTFIHARRHAVILGVGSLYGEFKFSNNKAITV